MGKRSQRGRFSVLINHLTTHSLTTTEEFTSIKNDWETLFDTCKDTTVFQSFTWNFTWWKHYKDKAQLSIVIVREKDRLVGIGPFVVRKRLGQPQIEPIGFDQIAYFGLLVEQHREDVAESIAAEITKFYPRGVIHFPYYAAGNIEIDNFIGYLISSDWRESRWIRNISHFVYELDGFSGLISRKSPRTQSTLRCEQRKLEKWGNIKVSHYCGVHVDEHLINEIGAIQKKSWLTRRGQEAISSSFYSEVLPVLAQRNHAEAFVLYVNEVGAAYVLNYCSHKSNYSIFTGFDEDYVHLSPGKYLQSECLKTTLNRGDSAFDFLFGDGDHKRFWSNRTRFVFRAVCYHGFMGWILSYFPHRIHGILSKYEFLRNMLRKTRQIRRALVTKFRVRST